VGCGYLCKGENVVFGSNTRGVARQRENVTWKRGREERRGGKERREREKLELRFGREGRREEVNAGAGCM
jgi:hypothetical protein